MSGSERRGRLAPSAQDGEVKPFQWLREAEACYAAAIPLLDRAEQGGDLHEHEHARALLLLDAARTATGLAQATMVGRMRA